MSKITLRIVVAVTLDEAALDRAYYGGLDALSKSAEVRELFSANPRWAPDVVRIHQILLAQDALNRHHGMPRACVTERTIVTVEKVDDE